MDDRNRPDGVDFGKTTPNIRISEHDTTRTQTFEEPPPRQSAAPPPPRPRRRIPIWVWLGAAVVFFFFLIVVAVLVYFLTRSPGFTMVVVGAPPGSAVNVDNVSRGVTSADGTIRVPGLKAGKRLLRVSNEGCTEFNTSVTGKDGEVRRVVVQLTCGPEKAGPLPNEIDVDGPMLLVGAGEFLMGDDNHNPDEKPGHRVKLNDFYIDKFEVTNEQYKKFCDATKRPSPTNPWWDDNYLAAHPRSPVLGVSWNDADAYAKWAGKRLPTEEEWEKAASWDATTEKKRQWPWGDNSDPSKANVGGTQRTTDVGQFPAGASPYGAQDMAGNVAEWVNAFYQVYPSGASSPEMGTKNRVVRGGTYKGDIQDARTTRRLFHTPQLLESEKKNRAFLIGFRCALSADDPKVQQRSQASQK